MSMRTATTIGSVALRSGAGQSYPVHSVLEPGTTVVILNDADDWLEVSVAAGEGFIARRMLLFPQQQVRDGFLQTALALESASGAASADADAPGVADSEAATVALEPPVFLRLAVGAAPDATQKLMASTWNRYGGLLAALATALKFDPGVAVAVFAIESGGRGFAQDGRMIIRFEVHIFFDHWGKQHPDIFNRHFRFNQTQRWKDHQWRPSPDEPWRDFHNKQPTEWEVFDFARTIDDRAAKLSMSMGGPQIMGFNHASIGYETVDQMFDAFSASERNQIIGFFDFVKGPSGSSRKVLALQERNFEAFAELYNGTGKGNAYASKMRMLFDAFRPDWEPLSIRRVNTAALNLRRTPEVRPDNIVHNLPRDTQVVLAVSEPVRTTDRVWVKVGVDQQQGWVNGAFLAPAVS